jgi:hypothetical protein
MTLARPIFPPRADTSRRAFLSQAAGAVGGSAVLAVATVPPAPAIAAPRPVPDASEVNPIFTAAVRALDEARRALEAARAVNDADDAKVIQWKAANPAPTSKRGMKRWARKLRDYRHDAWAESWAAVVDAERQFRAAQFAVAKIEPRDANELMLMAAVAVFYDNTRQSCGESAVIGYQVALSYVRIHGAAIGGAA